MWRQEKHIIVFCVTHGVPSGNVHIFAIVRANKCIAYKNSLGMQNIVSRKGGGPFIQMEPGIWHGQSVSIYIWRDSVATRWNPGGAWRPVGCLAIGSLCAILPVFWHGNESSGRGYRFCRLDTMLRFITLDRPWKRSSESWYGSLSAPPWTPIPSASRQWLPWDRCGCYLSLFRQKSGRFQRLPLSTPPYHRHGVCVIQESALIRTHSILCGVNGASRQTVRAESLSIHGGALSNPDLHEVP